MCICMCMCIVRTWTYKCVRASKRAKTREKEGGLAMDGRADEVDGMVYRGRTEILNVASERLAVAGALWSLDPSLTDR